MDRDETEIRELIARWAEAVHQGDMAGVLADHAEDIVMFDVPPPNEVRGKGAYRETWPPFFKYQLQGALFEIVSLDVTVGKDVAFAHALLKCGMPEELAKDPAPASGSPLGCARRAAAGWWRMSTIPSRWSRPGEAAGPPAPSRIPGRTKNTDGRSI